MLRTPTAVAWYRKPAWQAIGVIVVLLAIVLPWMLRVRQPRKELGYAISSPISFKANGLEVYYKGRLVQEAWSVVVHIENTGSVPITTNDFKGALQVIVLNGTILHATGEGIRPKDLTPYIHITRPPERPDLVEVDGLLLNPGDRLGVNLVTEGARPNPKVQGHIAGVEEVEVLEWGPPPGGQ